MLADVSSGHEVIEVVAEDFSEEDRHDWCEVQISDLSGVVPIATSFFWLSEQDGTADVDADGPSKVHEASKPISSEVDAQGKATY